MGLVNAALYAVHPSIKTAIRISHWIYHLGPTVSVVALSDLPTWVRAHMVGQGSKRYIGTQILGTCTLGSRPEGIVGCTRPRGAVYKAALA